MLLERDALDAGTVRYRVTLYVPEQDWRGRAEIAAGSGEVSFAPWEGEGDPPDWLVKAAYAFLRSLWNARRNDPTAPPWPRRLLRWRAAP